MSAVLLRPADWSRSPEIVGHLLADDGVTPVRFRIEQTPSGKIVATNIDGFTMSAGDTLDFGVATVSPCVDLVHGDTLTIAFTPGPLDVQVESCFDAAGERARVLEEGDL